MPLTRSFKETVQRRVQNDPDFREELLREGIEYQPPRSTKETVPEQRRHEDPRETKILNEDEIRK